MADSTPLLEQIVSSQSAKEATANALFDAASPATAFGRHSEACAGLTWGYYGTRFGGTPVANDAEILAASVTTYMVADLSTGAVSFATATTNWDDSAAYGRCYLIVTGADSVTSYEDHRCGPLGILGGGGASVPGTYGTAATLDFDTDTTLAANSDALLPTQKAVKAFVAANATGFAWKTKVQAATTTTLPANTYNNGTAGVGATLTGNANGALAAQDGVTLTVNQRLLVKDQAAPANNGIYALTQVGTGGTPYILTRATDADTSAEALNATVLVAAGTTQAGQQWTCNTPATITMGTTALTFVQVQANTGDASTNTAVSVDSEVALFSGTGGKTLKRASATGYAKLTSGVLSADTAATVRADLQGTGLVDKEVGYRNVPQNSKSAAYTTVAADAGQDIFHPAADPTARVFTIDNAVAYPVGAEISFTNQRGAGNITIAITGASGVLNWAGTAASVGSRTLAPNGWAQAKKLTSTDWLITGVGLT